MTRATEKSQLRPPLAALLAALAALVLAACGGDSGNGVDLDEVDPGNAASAPDYGAALDSAPPKLAELYGDGSGELRPSGVDEFEAELEELRGTPVLVNKWASWCGPCRAEFPHLQQQAAEHLDEVAFVGLNSGDSEDAARTFLEDHPVPYPSFLDPDEEIARSFGAIEFPVTIFIDREGEVAHIKYGPYTSDGELEADIDRYLLD